MIPSRNLLVAWMLLATAGPAWAGDVTLGEFSATSRSFRIVEVSTFRPAMEAPMQNPIEAISSSAWMAMPPWAGRMVRNRVRRSSRRPSM